MSRISATFANLKSQGRKALIPYVTAGFPFADITPELMHAMVAGGADVIELGVPFSDPSADGPVIQQAGEKALALGIGTLQVLEMVRTFRSQDQRTPVVLMGYANPVERYDIKHGKDAFIRDAAQAGVDGVLIVDYPPEECVEFAARLRAQGMDLIFLLAPTSTDTRMVLTSSYGASSSRWRPCCRAFASMCACPWAWALASAMRPRPRPSARWPMPW